MATTSVTVFSDPVVTVMALVALASLVPIIWAMVDMARRPGWQASTGRKTAWIVLLAVGWLILWPAALVVAMVYLVTLRHRMAPRPGPDLPGSPVTPPWLQGQWPGAPSTGAGSSPLSSSPAPPPAAASEPQPTAPPPPGWYPDPAGGAGWRWWDGVGWTEYVH